MLNTECGIFSIIKKNQLQYNILPQIIEGLHKLQHRGQESCGIAYKKEGEFIIYKDLGLVKNVFKNFKELYKPNICIGHVRYSTSGKKQTSDKTKIQETHPIKGTHKLNTFVLAHNGTLPNFNELKKIYNSTASSDTLFLVELIENIDKNNWDDICIELMNIIKGVFCIILLIDNTIYLLRDRFGYRPLCIAETDGEIIISSESYVFDYKYFKKDVNPGEIIKIEKGYINTIYTLQNNVQQKCIFEYIYFLNENTIMDNISVKRTREIFGQYLAMKDINKFNKNDYIVVGCPTSGIISGKNYAKLLNLPYKQIITKNKNTNRSFILPSNEQRIEMCKNKFNIDPSIKNKNIILIDDSIVRGNTLKILINLLRNMECNEVHIRISSPPIKGPCYYGIDLPTHSELITHNKTIEDIRIYIDADSLEYLTIEDLHNSMGNINNFCISCFTDKYKDINDW